MASNVKMPINPEIIIWARTTIGFSIDEAAKKLSVKPEKLISWEEGNDQPSYTQLKNLSKAYKRIK